MKPHTDKSWLYERYWRDGLTMGEMAEQADCSKSRIHHYMTEHGIPRELPWSRGELFWQQVNVGADDECWLWTGACLSYKEGRDYGAFHFNGESTGAHRYALSQSLDKPLEENALHHCDTPRCCNPAHLYEGDQSDNNQDAYDRNRREAPPGRPKALDQVQIEAIQRRAAAGGHGIQRQLADEYGVSEALISNIVEGEQ